jgi:hypothetical protein
MENMMALPTPEEAAAALAEADTSRARLAGGLTLPSFFYSSLGVTVAVQIAAGAGEVALDTVLTRSLAIAGAALFGLTAGLQLVRFRQLNGVRIGGLTSRVVLGTGWAAGVSYGLALTVACWAALAGRWWLVAVCAGAGGLGYALSGRRWVRRYRGDPASHARAESAGWLVAGSALALAAMALLVLVGR